MKKFANNTKQTPAAEYITDWNASQTVWVILLSPTQRLALYQTESGMQDKNSIPPYVLLLINHTCFSVLPFPYRGLNLVSLGTGPKNACLECMRGTTQSDCLAKRLPCLIRAGVCVRARHNDRSDRNPSLTQPRPVRFYILFTEYWLDRVFEESPVYVFSGYTLSCAL